MENKLICGSLIFLSLVIASEADITCGNYLCSGAGAYCCGSFDGECCFGVWTLWWFWLVWVAVFMLMLSCGWFCMRRYRSNTAARQYLIVPDHMQPVRYGAASTPYMVAPTAPQNAQPPVPPAYTNQKPPPYSQP